MSKADKFSAADFFDSHMREWMERMRRLDPYHASGGFSPAVDVYETENEIVVVAELAGVSREEVRVLVEEGRVRIYGNRKATAPKDSANYRLMEIESGQFMRTVQLSTKVDAGNTRAETRDGLLRIHLPKKPDLHSTTIEVECG